MTGEMRRALAWKGGFSGCCMGTRRSYEESSTVLARGPLL